MYLRNLFILLFLVQADCKLYPIAVRLPLNGTPPDLGGSLWPRPSSQQFGTERFYVDKSLQLSIDSSLNECERDILEKLWSHYQNVFYPPKLRYQQPASGDPLLKSVHFKLSSVSPVVISCAEHYYPFIQDTQAESYKLIVELKGAQVIAGTVWGLIRGLETFSQLIYSPTNTGKEYNKTDIIELKKDLENFKIFEDFVPLENNMKS